MKSRADFVKVRSFLFANVENLLEHMGQQRHMNQVSSDGLFGGEITTVNVNWDLNYKPQSKMAVLVQEKESLGLYVSGNPLSEYKDLLVYVQDSVYRDDVILILINKIKKIFTKKGDMMFALLVSTPFGDYEAIIFPKKAMELSPILLEKDIFWVVGKIEESQKSSTDKLDEEGKSTEYEQKPKILIDSMAPLEGDLLELLTKPTSVNNRQKQHNELSEASKKRIEALSIKDFLNTQITPADETNKTGLGNAQQKPIPNEPANSPKVIRIYQKYSMDLVKKIKSLLKSSEEKGLSQVTIEVQTDKEEWKKAKGSFWVDMTLLESLDTHD